MNLKGQKMNEETYNFLTATMFITIGDELITRRTPTEDIDEMRKYQTVDDICKWAIENSSEASRKYGLVEVYFTRIYIVNGKMKVYKKVEGPEDWLELDLQECAPKG